MTNAIDPKKDHHVIIVLGLGEALPLYKFLTKNWKVKYQIIPHIYVFGWKNEEEKFDTKLALLIELIENVTKKHNTVSLIGISAGASASLNAYIALKKKDIIIHKYISICGRFNLDWHWWYPLSIGYKTMPSFEESVNLLMKNIKQLTNVDYEKIICFSSIIDERVPLSASSLKKADKKLILMPFHFPAIWSVFLTRDIIEILIKTEKVNLDFSHQDFRFELSK